AADDRVPSLEPKAVEVATDPGASRARGDRELESERLGLRDPLTNSGHRLERCDELGLTSVAPGLERGAVERSFHEGFEVGGGLEPPRLASDVLAPGLAGQILPVLPVDLDPGLVRGHLGLEDEAVEVEDQRADHSWDANAE